MGGGWENLVRVKLVTVLAILFHLFWRGCRSAAFYFMLVGTGFICLDIMYIKKIPNECPS